MAADGYATFLKEAPAVAAAHQKFIEALAASQGLDEKTKHLIYIALNAALGNPGAAVAHVGFAKKLGASRDAVKDAILMTLTVVGLKGVTSCLSEVLAAYER